MLKNWIQFYVEPTIFEFCKFGLWIDFLLTISLILVFKLFRSAVRVLFNFIILSNFFFSCPTWKYQVLYFNFNLIILSSFFFNCSTWKYQVLYFHFNLIILSSFFFNCPTWKYKVLYFNFRKPFQSNSLTGGQRGWKLNIFFWHFWKDKFCANDLLNFKQYRYWRRYLLS